jgi:hypothetical protein
MFRASYEVSYSPCSHESDDSLSLPKVETIPAGQRTAKLMTELFPDFVGQG